MKGLSVSSFEFSMLQLDLNSLDQYWSSKNIALEEK